MYRHVLLAIDGSALALAAAAHGLALAKLAGAKATALIVTPSWEVIALSEIAGGRIEQDFARSMGAHAAKALGEVAAHASRLGVEVATRHVIGSAPYAAIVDVAREVGADLIVVGSHGRRGISKLLLGSEAMKLLSHAHVPVLVHRT